jgi:RHS repeat-associated protein
MYSQFKTTTTHYAFNGFGVPLIDPALCLDENTTITYNLFGFTGYQQDNIIDLYFAQARYYDANVGRFTGEDLIKGYAILPKSLNTYAYCWNDPLGLVDLDGLAPNAIDATRLADHIYDAERIGEIVPGTDGWKLEAIHTSKHGDNVSNLKIGLYSLEHPNGVVEYALVNKGTTPSAGVDWTQNASGYLVVSSDVMESIGIARQYDRLFRNQELTMVGYSKGGAEATANGVATNRNVMTFNPMTIDLEKYGLYPNMYTGDWIQHYVVLGDILNMLFGEVSIGETEYLDRQYGNWLLNGLYFAVNNHGLGAVATALSKMQGNQCGCNIQGGVTDGTQSSAIGTSRSNGNTFGAGNSLCGVLHPSMGRN